MYYPKKIESHGVRTQNLHRERALSTRLDRFGQTVAGHLYHFFYEGCLTNFQIGDEGEEATKLYPDVKYIRMDEYLKLYQ